MRKTERELSGGAKRSRKQAKGYCMLKYAAILDIWRNMRGRQHRLYFLPGHPVISLCVWPMASATSVMPGQPHRVSAIACHAN